jgi:large subunit ribosomal protein L25
MEHTLTAETGRPPGSRSANRLRVDGRVPGVVYGLGGDPVAVSVNWRELRRALTTEAALNVLITLEYDTTSELTIIKDLQRDPVRRDVVHVDFLRVDRDAAVEVEIPILIVGESKDLENNRGIAEQAMKSLTVKAKPGNIPSQFEIDITNLEVGSSITVADIDLPDGVATEVDPEAPIVSGVATRFSTAAEEAAEAQAEAAAEGEGGGDTGEAGSESGD